MPLRPVLQFPDRRLREVSKPIEVVTDEIRALAQEMLDVMYNEPGIGLAAPQLGVPVRLVVVDVGWNEEGGGEGRRILGNPEIVHRDGTITWTEGCLSVPDFQAEVERAAQLRLRATDLDGKPVEIDAAELEAVCFQHELDHLDGVLFIDRISRLKRSIYVRKRMKQLRQERDEAGPERASEGAGQG